MSDTQDKYESLLEYYPDIDRNRRSIHDCLQQAGTPVFICDREILQDRYHQMKDSLARHWGPHVIGYSFKTNYLVARSRIFQDLGGWAEVVSAREYGLARSLGFAGTSIIINGPHKPDESLKLAISDGAIINVNDQDELDRLSVLSSCAKGTVDIGIRLGMNLPALGQSRFGFSLENDEALLAIDSIRSMPGFRLAGLHAHLHGDTDDPDIYQVAATRVAEFLVQHLPDRASQLRYLDMGGGFPAHTPKPKSRSKWNPRPIDEYIQAIANGLKIAFDDQVQVPALVVEPGRYLTCDGIVLVTRVVHVKERDGVQIVNSDGSISMVPLTHYIPQIILPFSPELFAREGAGIQTIIYGSACRENDVLYEGAFPPVRCGDYLIHFAAGAYNSSMSPDFIFEPPGMKVIQA